MHILILHLYEKLQIPIENIEIGKKANHIFSHSEWYCHSGSF